MKRKKAGEAMKWQMPIGVDNFFDIRSKHYYFVDKTDFIRQLIDGHSAVTLITRPRRFGKTLTLSMLEYFFSIEKEVQSRHLFDGLAIDRAGADYMAQRGQYPVIFMSFKGMQQDTWPGMFQSFRLWIQREFNKYEFLLQGNLLNEVEKNAFHRIVWQQATPEEYQLSLLNLSEYLFRYYRVKPIILIDEYDTPLQTAYSHGFYDQAIAYFRTFFNNTLKGNEFLNFAILTGVLRIAKESIFSGLNNLDVYSVMDEEYSSVMGFTTAEVEKMAGDLQADALLPRLKAWYDGYRFGHHEIYNPWSVISCFAKRRIGDYWVNTSANEIIATLLQGPSKRQEERLLALLQGKTVSAVIREGLIYQDIRMDKDALYTLLLTTGYLTAVWRQDIPNGMLCQLKIPNEEVRHVFQSEILDRFCADGDVSRLYIMMGHLLHGQADIFSEELQQFILQLVSVYDAANKESFYHGFMLGMTALFLGKDYTVESNRESGYGRFDLAIIPRDVAKAGVIMEFKVAASEADMAAKAKEALQQIEEREYVTEFRQRGIHQVWKYGIAFCGKKILAFQGPMC